MQLCTLGPIAVSCNAHIRLIPVWK